VGSEDSKTQGCTATYLQTRWWVLLSSSDLSVQEKNFMEYLHLNMKHELWMIQICSDRQSLGNGKCETAKGIFIYANYGTAGTVRQQNRTTL
jgi:hypothetical protein